MRLKIPRPVLVALVAGELGSAALAWRDLARRSDQQVRGNKTAWRMFMLINPGNSLAYWLAGRR